MSKNDITGDKIKTKLGDQDKYAQGHDLIWGQKQRVIYYWAEGTWCDLEDFPTYTHMSDDVSQLTVPFDWTEEQVESHVRAACSRG